MNDFEIGDIVRLKSGGPSMTVKSTGAGSGSLVDCEWFSVSDQKIHQHNFRPEALEQCEASKGHPSTHVPQAKLVE